MKNAEERYLEGSTLLKSGESAKARARFNDAVELLLDSGWDLNSTPVLQRFFQDLLQQIHQDESRYLQPEEVSEERQEGAVVDELDRLDLIPITIDAALKDAVEADLAGTKYDIPIVLNEAVLKSLNYWLGGGKKYFADGLVRSGRYRAIIKDVFVAESIPLDVMYLAQVESLFKTRAVSRARARGIWQFGKWTAVRYGLKVNGYIDERSDPEKSTRAAARYLSDLFSMFKDWNLVLAAYNWGEANVQRLVERSGRSDFWDLLELRRNFPKETKNHVPLIQASIILARNPKKYGLPEELDAPLQFDRVPVSRPIDLRAAAKLLGVSLEQLKELNPALRGLSTPPSYADFELKVPVGTSPEISEKLAALPAVRYRPQPEPGGRYRVRPGDTLAGIAARYGVSAAALQSANGIRSPRLLKVGTWLSIPSSGSRSASRTRAPRITPTRISSAGKRAGGGKPAAAKSSVSRARSTSAQRATGGSARKGSAASPSASAPGKAPGKPLAKSPPRETASR